MLFTLIINVTQVYTSNEQLKCYVHFKPISSHLVKYPVSSQNPYPPSLGEGWKNKKANQ